MKNQINRKEIIINEIAYWKKNRLLPEQYCDYLLALYTEGDGIAREVNKLNFRKNIIYLLLLIPPIVFLLYFTELSLILQTVFALILILSGIFLIRWFYKNKLLYHFPLIITAFIFLFSTVEITLNIFQKNNTSLYLILSLNCFIWILVGTKLRIIYFQISGVLGLVILAIYIGF